MSQNERLFFFVFGGLLILSVAINYGQRFLWIEFSSFFALAIWLIIFLASISALWGLLSQWQREQNIAQARISSSGEILWQENFPFAVTFIPSLTHNHREGPAYQISPLSSEHTVIEVRSEKGLQWESVIEEQKECSQQERSQVLFFPGKDFPHLLIPSAFSLKIASHKKVHLLDLFSWIKDIVQ